MFVDIKSNLKKIQDIQFFCKIKLQHCLNMFTPVHKCEDCGYYTTSKLSIKMHSKRHKIKRITFDCEKNELEEFSCNKCQFKTQFLARFSQHLQESKCKIQKQDTEVREESVITELLYISDEIKQYRSIYDNLHKCKKCPYLSTSAFSIINHARLHKNHRKSFNCETTSLENFFCNECQFSTNYFGTFIQHIKGVHFYFKQNETKYVEVRERNTTETRKKLKKFQCHYCAYKAVSNSSLLRHINHKHTPFEFIQWHPCDQCQYRGKSLELLKRHITYNHSPIENIKIHPCSQCTYKAKSRHQLKKHAIFNHTPDNQIKWYKCDQCDYKAKQPDTLKTHKLSKHTSPDIINWHKCDHCDYKGKRRSDLERHLLFKHTPTDKIQWHQCEQCDHKSKSLSNLKKHTANVHTPYDEIKWYQCEHCGWKCKRRNDLARHIRVKHAQDKK